MLLFFMFIFTETSDISDMLQFVTAWPSATPIDQQVSLAVAGGCRWIELSAPGMSEEELRKTAEAIIPPCREADAIVIMRDHRHLAGELRLGGIYLDKAGGESPREVREKLGGEAIIGVEAATIDDIRALRRIDIDYAVIAIPSLDAAQAAIATVQQARREDIKLPIVAMGEFSIDDCRALLSVGFSGIALSAVLADAPDIAAATAEVLAALQD